MRRVAPVAAGSSLLALARGEVLKQEAKTAFAVVFGGLAILTLLVLRRIADWFFCLVPTILSLCLSAAAITATGQLIGVSSLTAAMLALTMSICASLLLMLAGREEKGPHLVHAIVLPRVHDWYSGFE